MRTNFDIYVFITGIYSKLFKFCNVYFQATGPKIGNTLEALATIIGALFIAFLFSWKLTLVVLGFMPLMIITGIVQNKILTGFAKEDKAALDGAGRVGFSMHLS